MPINGMPVMDAVVHGFDHREENVRVKYARQQNHANFAMHSAWSPPGFAMTESEWFIAHDADTMLSMAFDESHIDFVCYHSIPAWGMWHDNSPMSVGLEMRRRAPGRVFLYGAVSPADGKKALDDLQRQADEWGPISGIKLYPFDFVNGDYQGFDMSDREIVYPIYEKCLELGIKTVAMHKAIPVAGLPMDPLRVGDVDYAAYDFPDLNFEVVHGGFAFLEETCAQLSRFPNVFATLEGNTGMLLKWPRKFAHMMGQMLMAGPDKLTWASGGMVLHPQPMLQAFIDFEMPEDLIEGFGYGEMTPEIKRGVLADNWFKMNGHDDYKGLESIPNDQYAGRGQLARPWTGLRDRELTA